MKTSVIFLTVLFLSLSIFNSCRHEPLVEPTPQNAGLVGGSTDGKVCFESDILPIFQSTCAKGGCHDATSHKEGYVLDNYANIIKKGLVPGNASSSELYKVLFNRGEEQMPVPPNPELSSQQKNLIGTWINEGAENSTKCGSNCDTTLFAFTANVVPILQKNCAGCHNAASASGGINLDGYTNVKIYATNGKLYGSIAHLPGFVAMPQNGSKLSDCNLRVIQKWIQAGALNN